MSRSYYDKTRDIIIVDIQAGSLRIYDDKNRIVKCDGSTLVLKNDGGFGEMKITILNEDEVLIEINKSGLLQVTHTISQENMQLLRDEFTKLSGFIKRKNERFWRYYKIEEILKNYI